MTTGIPTSGVAPNRELEQRPDTEPDQEKRGEKDRQRAID